MVVEITHLGTGTALPDATRGPTATLLRCGDTTILVDLGSGTLQKLAQAGVSVLELDAVLLTHAHLDHIADLAPLLFALAVPGMVRTTRLQIIGSGETLRYVAGLRDVFGKWVSPPEGAVEFVVRQAHEPAVRESTSDVRNFDVRDSTSDVRKFGVRDLSITAHAVRHTASSLGYRIRAGDVTIAIPGDTGPCEGLAEVLRDADYAIVECSVPDALPMDEHMHPSALAGAASAAGVRRLAVVHRYPFAAGSDVEEQLRALCPMPVTFPNDGERVLIGVGA